MMEDLHEQIDEPVREDMESSNLNTAQTGMRVSLHQEARLERVLNYQIEILKKEGNREAALGTVTAGLMTVAIQMEEFIQRAFAANPTTIDQMQRLLPCVQVYLQTTRQIDRLTQVELRVGASRKSKPVGKADNPANPR